MALRLPYVAIQPSLPHVVRDILAPSSSIAVEDCWVSCYGPTPRSGDTGSAAQSPLQLGSVHGRIRLSEADEREDEVECQARDERVQVEMHSPSQFSVACPGLAIPPTEVLFPSPRSNPLFPTTSSNPTSQELPPPSFHRLKARGRRGGMTVFAPSPDGKRIVAGGTDGQAQVLEVIEHANAASRVSHDRTWIAKGKEIALRGHVGDLTDAAFFPSSEVILTASADMTLRVFSAADGSSPRTLKGHTKRITSQHILASASPSGPHKGRQVLSSSLDGTIRLWDVASASNEQTWALSQPVSCMLVLQRGVEDSEDVLKGKVALAGLTDGTVACVDLATPPALSGLSPAPTLARTRNGAPVEALACEGDWLAIGGRIGVTSLFHLPAQLGPEAFPQALEPLAEWTRTEGGTSVSKLAFSPRSRTGGSRADAPPASSSPPASILVATTDGLAYRANLAVTDPEPAEGGSRSTSVRVCVEEEFVGPDCEPTTCIREDARGRVWISAGGTDGSLRVYERVEAA